MGTTFYIHIGVPKTGTTSIQKTMFANRDRLLAHGINYLSIEQNHSTALLSLVSDTPHRNHGNIRNHVDTPEKANSYNAWVGRQLTKELSRNRSPKMAISGEGLAALPEAAVGKLKQIFDPYADAYRIIVYVRSPYDYANSSTLQRIKHGLILADSHEKLALPKYRRRIGKYIRTFGRENVDIRIFDPRRFPGGDVVCDFLVALGESPQLAEGMEIARLNQAMSHEAAVILSETNRAIPTHIDMLANRARAFNIDALLKDIEGEKFSIDPNDYLKIEADTLADLEWLHRTIGQPVFGRPVPRPASIPRWSEATVRSIKNMVGRTALKIQQLENDLGLSHVARPAVPAGLEWLREASAPSAPGQPEARSDGIPRFDPASIRSLACFIHGMALTMQHLKAEKAVRSGRWLILKNPRTAERHFRSLVRLNPGSAAAQHRLSQACLLSGKLQDAREAAESAVKLAPRHAPFRRWLWLVKAADRLLSRPRSYSQPMTDRQP